MKRFLLTAIFFVSCTSAPIPKPLVYTEGKEYLGTWMGEVLVVNVEATFSEREYQFKTIASNGVWFSGTKGEFYQTAPDMMLAKQTSMYVYDQEIGVGDWVPIEPKVFPIEWHFDLEHNALVLSPNGSEIAIVLFRIK